MYDTTKMKFVAGFRPQKLQLVLDKGRTLVCAFEGEWKGRQTFNIRELYEEFGEWNPGKGVMCPLDQKDKFLKSVAKLYVDSIRIDARVQEFDEFLDYCQRSDTEIVKYAV